MAGVDINAMHASISRQKKHIESYLIPTEWTSVSQLVADVASARNGKLARPVTVSPQIESRTTQSFSSCSIEGNGNVKDDSCLVLPFVLGSCELRVVSQVL